MVTDIKELKPLGLLISQMKIGALGKEFAFESPISLSACEFRGGSSVGLLSYARFGGVFYSVQIGRYCSIAPRVFCGAGEHPVDWLTSHPFAFNGSAVFQGSDYYDKITAPELRKEQPKYGVGTVIGNDVWIGQGVTISRGLTIGDGAVIASGAVVTKDVAPYSVVGGVPAKEIRQRFAPAVIDRLRSIEWWRWDLSPFANEMDYRDIHGCLDRLERARDEQKLRELVPQRHVLRIAKGKATVDSHDPRAVPGETDG